MRLLVTFAALLALGTGINYYMGHNHDAVQATSEEMRVQTPIINTEGKTIGQAVLMQVSKGVLIHVEAEGLPQGWHALHLHEFGVCEAPSFKSAGEHYNPTKKKHGYDNPQGFHAGDLPNVYVDQTGAVQVEFFTDQVTLEKGKDNSLLKEGGTAIILHEGADDYQTDPAGGAGNRLACGVISESA